MGPQTSWGVVHARAAVVAEGRAAVALVVALAQGRAVGGQLTVVNTHAAAVCVGIRQKASLQYLIGRVADTIHHVGRRIRGLLHVGVVVFGDAVQLKNPHFLQRKIGVGPHLGRVKRVSLVASGLVLGHDLDKYFPVREVALRDGINQVVLREIGGEASYLVDFGIS